MEIVKDYDGRDGSQAFQGDVCIFRVPPEIGAKLNRADEVKPVAGRLILQEGEFSGHHHAIGLQPVMFYHDDALAREMVASMTTQVQGASKRKAGAARLYRDPALAEALVRDGVLTRPDLCVGFLEVRDAPMVVQHQEHDGIRLSVGLYYVGNQVESAGAEERRVQD